MARPSPARLRISALTRAIGAFSAAWGAACFLFANETQFSRFQEAVQAVIARVLAGFPAVSRNAQVAFIDATYVVALTFVFTLAFGTVFAALGAATRMLARARVRAGQGDFLDALRGWTAKRSGTTRALLALPAAGWALLLVWPGGFEVGDGLDYATNLALTAVPIAASCWGMFAMTRKGLRALLAPTIEGETEQTRFEIGPDEIVFDAVAVTRETLATVALFTAIVLAVPAFIWTRPILELFQNVSLFYVLGGYIAFAALGALAFRKASRVSVGVDGVHIRGTSRARFFAYRDLDSARANGSDLELVRRGKVVLKLQLHGEDAGRRDAVLARITERITQVQEGRGAMAAQMVAASSKEDLLRVASGAGDYRLATMTREQLWALVEGPEVDARARRAAAEALAASSDAKERTRLRVAAEQCAEPQVRIALEEIAGDDGAPPPAARTGLASL
jgi:hypothetical protein